MNKPACNECSGCGTHLKHCTVPKRKRWNDFDQLNNWQIVGIVIGSAVACVVGYGLILLVSYVATLIG
jgi:hypothetical protein